MLTRRQVLATSECAVEAKGVGRPGSVAVVGGARAATELPPQAEQVVQERELPVGQACSSPGSAESPESKPYTLSSTRSRTSAGSVPVAQGGEVGGGKAEGDVVDAEMGKKTENGAFFGRNRYEVMRVAESNEATDATAI